MSDITALKRALAAQDEEEGYHPSLTSSLSSNVPRRTNGNTSSSSTAKVAILPQAKNINHTTTDNDYSFLRTEGETEYIPLKVRRAQEEAARRKRMRTTNGAYDDNDNDNTTTTSNRNENDENFSSTTFTTTSTTNNYESTNSKVMHTDSSLHASVGPPDTSLIPSSSLSSSVVPPVRSTVSLLEQARLAQANGQVQTEQAKQAALEADILAQIKMKSSTLASAAEHAQGIRYTESLTTDWRPPLKFRSYTEEKCTTLRKTWHIDVSGESIPPPISSFKDMRFPLPIIHGLEAKGIKLPTPIQVQGLPVLLTGRDMIGIAFTGSGKTIAFSLPLIMFALQEERRLPLVRGEGPIGVILAPSRELARQHADTLEHFAKILVSEGFPELRVITAIGGEDLKTQLAPLQKGVHMIVATPGRLQDHLVKRRLTLDLCRYIVLDEGDRMLDTNFEENIKEIFSFFKQQRQTVIFSATMPQKIIDFARESLVKPVIVNVGRAGAANLDVIQEVEYVKQDAKIVYLLTCLQKTAPPVVIFAENKRDVDDIQEYLLLKGVESVSIHGDKTQEERNEAIRAFKDNRKDVLVATDVAAKGLDFPDIQHVINFDMPKDIETYVHRIGRTGRCGKTGVATTFINKSVDEKLLIDLKVLLREAKQRLPPVLLALEDPIDIYSSITGGNGTDGNISTTIFCAYCNGAHRVTECPKLERERKQHQTKTKDYTRGIE